MYNNNNNIQNLNYSNFNNEIKFNSSKNFSSIVKRSYNKMNQSSNQFIKNSQIKKNEPIIINKRIYISNSNSNNSFDYNSKVKINKLPERILKEIEMYKKEKLKLNSSINIKDCSCEFNYYNCE